MKRTKNQERLGMTIIDKLGFTELMRIWIWTFPTFHRTETSAKCPCSAS